MRLSLPNFATARVYWLYVIAFVAVSIAFVVQLALDFTLITVIATALVLALNVAIIRRLVIDIFVAMRPVADSPEKLPCPPHLRHETTGRGCGYFPALPNEYGGAEDVSARELSNAEYAGIWLDVAGMGDKRGEAVKVTANLTAGTAWRLAEQLAILVATHYHGDQRPAPADTVLSVDLSRLDVGTEVSA